MSSTFPRLLLLVTILCVSLCSSLSFAAQVYVPPELEPWKEWVLEEHGDVKCPFLYSDAQYQCVWPSKLELNIDRVGAKFSMAVTVFNKGWVSLPGDNRYWPQTVVTDGKPLQVRGAEGRPEVFLIEGEHNLQGAIEWEGIPRSLRIPQKAGLLKVTIDKKLIVSPVVDGRSQLWLGQKQQQKNEKEQDGVDVQVFRHLQDDIPLKQTTVIRINVSGSEREILLGRALLEGFKPMSLESPLPARIEPDGSLRVQVKPGTWLINLSSRYQGKNTIFASQAMSEDWPRQELWVFQANPQLHTVDVTGAETIDPQQTQLPDVWKNLPVYVINPDTKLTITEQYRGDTTPAANQLTLKKQMWLDFDGKNFTVEDIISGGIHRHWRLSASNDYKLGRVTLNGEPQVITHLAGESQQGFELRSRSINANVISRVVNNSTLPVTGWQEDFNQVNTTLHIPPGWSLLNVSGADTVSDSWVSEWTLWDIFLVLIITVAISRICGRFPGVIAFVTLLFIYQRADAPVYIWLNIAAVTGLLSVTTGALKQWLVRYQALSFLTLVIILIPFSVDYIRQAFYPQLEKPFQNIGQQYNNTRNEGSAYQMDELQSAPQLMMDEDISVSNVHQSQIKEKRTRVKKQRVSSSTKRFDANLNIQTGPGVPQWRWNQASFQWSGPVKPSETVSMLLVPPVLNRIGHVLAVLFSALLGLQLFAKSFNTIRFTAMVNLGSLS